jgi:hypothetical protein
MVVLEGHGRILIAYKDITNVDAVSMLPKVPLVNRSMSITVEFGQHKWRPMALKHGSLREVMNLRISAAIAQTPAHGEGR